jgi:hypothetical protein
LLTPETGTGAPALAEIYAQRGQIVHDVQYLRATREFIHKEIDNTWDKWLDLEVKKVNKNWSWQNNKTEFIREVKNDNAFWRRLLAQERAVERIYGPHLMKATTPAAEVEKIYNKIKTLKQVSKWVMGTGSRMAKVVPTLTVALAFLTIIGDTDEGVGPGGHTPDQAEAWEELQTKYVAALEFALRFNGPPDKERYLEPLRRAYIKYFRSVGVPDAVLTVINRRLELYLADK